MRRVHWVALVLLVATTAACGSANGAAHPPTTGARQRTPSPTARQSPVPEPPIAFTQLSGSFWSIDTVDANGSDVQHLVDIARAAPTSTAPLDSLGQAAWSPDRTRLAFTCVTTASSICVSTADGSGARVLRLPGHLLDAADPSWSPDGTRIAFTGLTSTSPIRAQIYVMNADGSRVHSLTSNAKGAADPTWSPDGAHIAYESLDQDIWIMNADGTGAHALRVTTARELEPAWSPDGKHIAFSVVTGQATPGATTEPTGTTGPGNQSSVFVMNADGTLPTELTQPGVGLWPAWSPDGREIAYMCGRLPRSNICVMNADGTGQRTLVGGPTIAMQPAWS